MEHFKADLLENLCPRKRFFSLELKNTNKPYGTFRVINFLTIEEQNQLGAYK